MSRGEDGFLGRWSRLKRAGERPAPEAEAAPGPTPEPEPDPAPPEAEPLSDEDLAALPRIEDLAEGSDIRAFLRAGVPRHMRNAALRRMWMLTPAIRDYRDPAVDYAWDWNTPGGVPGDGVAPSPERAAEMLRTLVSPREKPAPDLSAEDAPDRSEAEATVAAGPGEATSAASGAPPDARPEAEAAAQDPAPEAMPRRRHGSALPG